MGIMRLATWNLLHGRSLAAGAVDGDELYRSVALLDADILAVQEVDRGQLRSGGTDQAALVADAAGAMSWRYEPALWGCPGQAWEPVRHGPDEGRADTGGPSYGIGLVSRYPVTHWRARRFAPPPVAMPLLVPGRPGLTWMPDEPRVALAAVVRAPTGPVTVAAAHLSTVPGWNARQLWHVARWLRDLPAPRFLLGDFNLPAGVPELVSGWRGLVRARTYPSWRPVIQFDHVLAQGVHPSGVLAAAACVAEVSDHRALRVDVDHRALTGSPVVPVPASGRSGRRIRLADPVGGAPLGPGVAARAEEG
jgi:endonuclease/exonuclease/phosphatase family metal-dependent hydrolase